MADASIPTAHESCKTCRFWLGQTTRPGIPGHCEAVDYGRCRFNPPVGYEYDGGSGTAWPVTNGGDWCGKFEARG